MKKIIIGLIMIMSLALLCGCSTNTNSNYEVKDDILETTENTDETENVMVIEEPDLSQIRSICKLATLECYYHNVAKSIKGAGTGLSHLGESDRKFWVEYTGVVKIGVDMSRGSMDVDGSNITIYIPEAEILSIKPDSNSTSDTIAEADSINSNPIEADDVTKAVAVAEQSIRESIENDSSLLVNAQDRAKKLIENYVNQLGEISGVHFNITWQDIHNTAKDVEGE